jgi:hypothetical protein
MLVDSSQFDSTMRSDVAIRGALVVAANIHHRGCEYSLALWFATYILIAQLPRQRLLFDACAMLRLEIGARVFAFANWMVEVLIDP